MTLFTFNVFQSRKQLYNHKCHHPSSFIFHTSSFFIHPSSSFIILHSSFLHFATFKLFSLFDLLWSKTKFSILDFNSFIFQNSNILHFEGNLTWTLFLHTVYFYRPIHLNILAKANFPALGQRFLNLFFFKLMPWMTNHFLSPKAGMRVISLKTWK